VVAARHPEWDERPLLLIVPRPGREAPSPEAMRRFLAGKVAKWWLPDAVIALEELPHTATGKVNKRALRERWGGHLTTDDPPGTGAAAAAD
jgi:fatty-acyl-CoA synthase